MASTVVKSMRISADLDGALRSIEGNQASLVLGIFLLGLNELAHELDIDLSDAEADLTLALKYSLPDALQERLKQLREDMGGVTPKPRAERKPRIERVKETASEQTEDHAASNMSESPSSTGWDALASEGDDY